MFEGFIEYGGVEVVNSARIAALTKQAGVAWIIGPTYPELAAALGSASDDSGDDSGGTPAVPSAPIGYFSSAPASANTVINLSPSSPTGGNPIAVGDWVIAVVHVNAPSGDTITPADTGWTELQPGWGTVGTMLTKIYARERGAGETSYNFNVTNSRFLNGALFWVRNGDVVANWTIGVGKARTTAPTSSTVNMALSLTGPADDSLVVGFSFERTTATETGISSISGATEWFFAAASGSSITTTDISTSSVDHAEASQEIDTTYPNSQATNGWAFQIAIPPTPASGDDTPGDQTPIATVDQFLNPANAPMQVAHRGSELDWSEGSLIAYLNSAAYNRHLAFEVPLWMTVDGVQVISEDRTPTRLFGPDAPDITTSTWAALKGLTNTITGEPIARLEDVVEHPLLANRVLLVDAKRNTTDQINNLLAYTDSHGGPARFLAKGPIGSFYWADQATARGYKSWGYAYPAAIGDGTLAAQESHWTILGMDVVTGVQSDMEATLEYGKPTIGHIAATKTQYNNALAWGASGVMISHVTVVISNYPPAPPPTPANFGDITLAPWYDPTLADVSSRFYGVYGLKFDNVYDSTRTVAVTQNSGEGGTIGAYRKGTPIVTVSATLIAKGSDAMEYGRAWLEQVLELAGCAQDEDCGKAEVHFFSTIPADPNDAVDKSRYLKSAGTTSGPFAVNEYSSRGVWNTDVEWTWTAERPGIYGVSRPVDLTVSPALAVIQDTPINWIPYPSAEVADHPYASSTTVIARNMAVNGSGEDGIFTGWTASASTTSGSSAATYLTGTTDQGAISIGVRSFLSRILGDGATTASGVASLGLTTPMIDLSQVPSGRLLELAIWAAASLVSGPGSVGALNVTAQFYTSAGATVGSAVPLSADARGVGLFTAAPMAIPATATQVKIGVSVPTTWQSGASDAANTDARLYAGGLTVAYLGA